MAQATAEPRTETRNSEKNMFDQMSETFKSTMDAGMRAQNDVMQSMFDVFTGRQNDDVRVRMERITSDSISTMRKNAEHAFKMIDENCKNGMDSVKKTFDMSNGRKDADMMDQCRSMWKTGADTMCQTMDTVTRANVQMIENWASFMDNAMRMPERKNTAK